MKFLFIFILIASTPLFAVTAYNISDKNPRFFRTNYFFLGIDRNFPAIGSKNYLEAGKLHGNLGFFHVISEDWSIGLSGGFKLFKTSRGDEQHIASFSQETDYFIRLYHPLYLQGCAKVMYLSVGESATIPFRRNRSFDSEVGVAFALNLMFFLSPDIAFSGYVERWRGTKTMKLHGVESGLRAYISL